MQANRDSTSPYGGRTLKTGSGVSGNADGPIDLDGINLEQNEEESSQARTNGSRSYGTSGEGRPSRISAYRKNPSLAAHDKSPISRGASQDDIMSPGGVQSEHEVKFLINNIKEVHEIRECIEKSEACFSDSKKKLNRCDIASLESDANARALELSYQIIKASLAEENAAFDQERMEQQVNGLREKVATTNSGYTKFKGAWMAVNDSIVNKDLLAFKLDRAQSYSAKQAELVPTIPDYLGQTEDNLSLALSLRKKYEGFQKNQFEKQLREIDVVYSDSAKTLEHIHSAGALIQKKADAAVTSLEEIKPHGPEQLVKLRKLHQDLATILKKAEGSARTVDHENNNLSRLETVHQENIQLLDASVVGELATIVSQARLMWKFVENLLGQRELNRRLKGIAGDSLGALEHDLQRALADLLKFADSIKAGNRDEHDELLRAIQKLAKKVAEDAGEQVRRLDDFDGQLAGADGTAAHVAEPDLIFVRKEVYRYRAALETVESETERVLKSALKLRDAAQSRTYVVTQDEVFELQSYHTLLERLQAGEVPRVKRHIDQLEAFSLKALKNGLNDDNKKSQNQISKMKKNYEDLQKQIDALNAKLGKVGAQVDAAKEAFTNADLERENEIAARLDGVLDDCERDVNGDKAAARGSGVLAADASKTHQQKDNSLQARKKTIIAMINKMVNAFNESNKMIKDSNKVAKTEREMADIIKKNKEIQVECQTIDNMIGDGKAFALQVNERLDGLLDPVLLEVKEKYTEKNQAIDECDELFDKANAQIDRLDGALGEQLLILDEIVKKLESVNPIVNPTPAGTDNGSFLAQVSKMLDRAHKLRAEAEAGRGRLRATRDKLINIVQPLNELEEREVKEPELAAILKALDTINEDLMNQEKGILHLNPDITALKRDVDGMLDQDKLRKIQDLQDKMATLDVHIGDLQIDRDGTFKKLNVLKALIAEAKAAQGREDPELLAKIRDIEADAKVFEKDLGDVDTKIADLKKKRGDAKKLLNEVIANPEKFTPQQIDGMLIVVDELNEKAEGIKEKLITIEQGCDIKIEELKNLVNSSSALRSIKMRIKELQDQLKNGMKGMKDLMGQLPGEMDAVQKVLLEMELGATPDETADYWEERHRIASGLKSIKELQVQFAKLEKAFQKKQIDIEAADNMFKKAIDLDMLKQIVLDYTSILNDLELRLNDGYDIRDGVIAIKKDMAECELPVNIACRRNDIQKMSERLDRIVDEFKELKQADEDFEGDTSSEEKIKKHIVKIDGLLRGFDKERKEYFAFQANPLEKATQRDFLNFTICIKLIIQVREFKIKIHGCNLRLDDLEDLLTELNTMLIQQDMTNASKLLGKKAAKLRERLTNARDQLKKISGCGDEMNGNTTHNEEEEFIDALKDEMPQVFKNIEVNFEQIDGIDRLLVEVVRTESVDKMQVLKKEVDEVTGNVEQSEGLVLKLENEIIEWNAHKKLCRRDEELAEIDALVLDFDDDLSGEHADMEKELQKNQAKLEKDGDPKGTVANQRAGITSYLGEIEELLIDVRALKKEKDQCFGEFDEDIPRPVKEERAQRVAQEALQNPKGRQSKQKYSMTSDKPTNIYYMVTINCRYRLRIHTMLKTLRSINQRRKDLENKYAPLKRELSAIKVVQRYKPVKGDDIDELFAFHLNKANLNLAVKRTGVGKYLFGTKNILAKIINGKLVIRVGGGYMSADEFIGQYGQVEIIKMMKMNGEDISDMNSNGSAGRGSLAGGGMGMHEAKNMMRQSLLANVKTYETSGSKDTVSRQSVAISGLSKDTFVQGRFGQGTKSPSPARNQMARNSSASNFGLMSSPKNRK